MSDLAFTIVFTGGMLLLVLVVTIVAGIYAARKRRTAWAQARAIEHEQDPARRLEMAAALMRQGGGGAQVEEAAAKLSALASSIARVQQLASHGHQGRARLVAVRRTGRSINLAPELEVTLQLPNAPPTQVHWYAASWAEAQLQPGASVPVRYLPTESNAIALDVAALHVAPLGQPQGERSRACDYCAVLFPAAQYECPNCGAPVRANR